MIRHKLEIEREAYKLRRELNIETYGIKDIFTTIDKLDIFLIRIPLGKDTICGFSTVYGGKKVIVSNSSEILSREIFTIAHELGHCIYDLVEEEQKMIVDSQVNSDSENYIEQRADYFAAAFLLPEEQIRSFIKFELKKEPIEINALDIVRFQTEFNASYASIVRRLHELGFITSVLKSYLFDERNSKTSKMLFRAMDYNESLLKPAEILKVPNRYYEYLFSNFDNGYIKLEKLKEALNIVGYTEEIEESDAQNSDETDLDLFELIEGY